MTLSKAVFNNALRNLAVLKYIFTKRNNSQDHTFYYKNLDILKDKWFESLPEDEIEQGNFIESEGSKTYILETIFFDYLIKNNGYQNVLDFGCGDGRLAAVLATHNENVNFLCLDINKSTEELNNLYKVKNLNFSMSSFFEQNNLKDTLIMARMSLAYLNPNDLQNFLSFCHKNQYDIALADITRFRLNKESKISYTQQSKPVYSHPYKYLLSELGYEVKIDMQEGSALMNFTTYLFPEFLNLIYGRIPKG